MPRSGMIRRGMLTALVVGTLLAAPVTAQTPVTVSGLTTASAPAVRVPSAAPPPPGRALLVSDSAWLSFKLYGAMDSVQGFDHTMALASCRRRVSTSCVNFNGYVPITMYQEVNNHPTGFATLIVATGYNDSDHNFSADVGAITTLARAHGYQQVVWLTLRSNVSYLSPGNAGHAAVFERNNATLQQIVAAGTYPELVIADWATYARDRHDWFSPDGIHLRTAGAYAAGDYVSRKMAYLHGHPCPHPPHASGDPTARCPDPDVFRPDVDLASLYPLDQRGPEASFQLSWEGSGSWPAPPWWQR